MQRNPTIRVSVTQRIYCVSLLLCLRSFGVQAAAATDLTGDLTDPKAVSCGM